MPMVSKFEDLFQVFYGSFSSSPKHHFEFTKFVKIVKIERLKVFQNVKTRLINMLQPLKHVWEKYKTLIINMEIGYSLVELIMANLLNLIGIDTIIGFT